MGSGIYRECLTTFTSLGCSQPPYYLKAQKTASDTCVKRQGCGWGVEEDNLPLPHLNPLTPRVKPLVIKNFLTFDSMNRTLKCDHSLESSRAILYCGAAFNFTQFVILESYQFWTWFFPVLRRFFSRMPCFGGGS